MKSSTAKVTALITYMKEEEEGKVCVCMRGGDEDIPQPNSRLPYLTRGPIFNRAIHTSSWNKKRKKKMETKALGERFSFFFIDNTVYIYIYNIVDIMGRRTRNIVRVAVVPVCIMASSSLKVLIKFFPFLQRLMWRSACRLRRLFFSFPFVINTHIEFFVLNHLFSFSGRRSGSLRTFWSPGKRI